MRRRITAGVAQRTAALVLINLMGVAGTVVLLRRLGVANFGRYGVVMSAVAIVQALSEGGLASTGARELSLAGSGERVSELLAHLIGLRLLLGVLGLVVTVALVAALGYSPAVVSGAGLAAAGGLVATAQTTALLPLAVEFRNLPLAAVDVSRQFLLLAMIVVLALSKAPLVWFFGAQFCAPLAAAVTTPLLVPGLLVTPRFSAGRLRQLAAATLPVAAFGALWVLYFRVMVLLVAALGTNPAEVGVYVVSARVLEAGAAVPALVVSVLMPALTLSARESTDGLRRVTLRVAHAMLFGGALFALLVATGARPLVLLLGGHSYIAAVPVLRIQAAAFVSLFTGSAWAASLVGAGESRRLLGPTAIGLFATVAFAAVLIPAEQAKGAAASAVLADVVFGAAVYVSARRAGVASSLGLKVPLAVAGCLGPPAAIAVDQPFSAALTAILCGAICVVLAALLKVPPLDDLGRVAKVFAAGPRAERPS